MTQQAKNETPEIAHVRAVLKKWQAHPAALRPGKPGFSSKLAEKCNREARKQGKQYSDVCNGEQGYFTGPYVDSLNAKHAIF